MRLQTHPTTCEKDANPLSTAEERITLGGGHARLGGVSVHAWHIQFDRGQSSIIYSGE